VQTIPRRPVAIRAMRRAISLASVPEQEKITLSAKPSCRPATRSARRMMSSCRYREWTFSVACWRPMASATRGLPCPTQGTLLYMST